MAPLTPQAYFATTVRQHDNRTSLGEVVEASSNLSLRVDAERKPGDDVPMKMFTCGASKNFFTMLVHISVTESRHAEHGAHHIEHGLQHCGPLAWRRPMKACTEDPFLSN